MPTARFVLKDTKSKEPTLIFLMFRYDYKALKYSTGISISTKFWNIEDQKIRETQKIKNASDLNLTLSNLKNGIEAEYRRLLNEGIYPTHDRLKIKLNVSS